MADLLETTRTPAPEAERFESEGDLRRDNRLGSSRLRVTDKAAYRYEGDELIEEFVLEDLKNPRVEDLVDASALVADYRGTPVELLRTTSKRALQIAGAEKRLDALLKGEDMPELEDAIRLCPKCGRPLPENTSVCEACLDRGKTMRRLFAYAAPYKSRLWLNLFLTILGTVAALAPPRITQFIVDRALAPGGQPGLLLPLVGGLVFVLLANAAITVVRGRNVAWLGREITVSIQHSLFEKLQSLSLSFYDKRNVGSIMSRMTNDTGQLYDVLIDGFPVVLNMAAVLIGVPIVMLLTNAQVAFWALLPIPFIMFGVNRFRKRMHRVWSRNHHQRSRLSGALSGILQGERVVKAFHGESREVRKFNRRISDLAGTSYEAESSWVSFFPLLILGMGLGGAVVWYSGGLGVLKGIMTVGQLFAFVGYVAMLREPMMMLQRVFDWSTRALTAAERVFEVMDTPVDIQDAADAVPMPSIKGAVTFTRRPLRLRGGHARSCTASTWR